MEGMDLTRKLNAEFNAFFKEVFNVIKKIPDYFLPILRHLFRQWQAMRKRTKQETGECHIPPFIIFSITKQCNLNCKGCYSKHLHQNTGEDLTLERIDSIIGEAEDLGISIILLAGGEPLLRQGIVSLANRYRKIIFPIFTNGMLIDEHMAREILIGKNILPVISLEGDAGQTDNRRGQGVYESVIETFQLLKRQKVLFGTSITVTRDNFERVTSDAFISDLIAQGCSVVFYIEYIPCSENSEGLIITSEERLKLKQVIEAQRMKHKMVFVSFPGDEEVYGGCLAAGRGFIHISSSGRVEPCPFSPFSDISLNQTSLKNALTSHFLKKIRDNRDLLSEHAGGCALWENREWVSKALKDE